MHTFSLMQAAGVRCQIDIRPTSNPAKVIVGILTNLCDTTIGTNWNIIGMPADRQSTKVKAAILKCVCPSHHFIQ